MVRTIEERLARLEVHMEYVHPTIREMRATQLEIRDTQIADKAASGARNKMLVRVGSVMATAGGVVGSLVGWMISHGWVKLPLAFAAVLMLPTTARAQLAPQPTDLPVVEWAMLIKICAGEACKEHRREVASQSACEVLRAILLLRVPLMETTPPLKVSAECLGFYGEGLDA